MTAKPQSKGKPSSGRGAKPAGEDTGVEDTGGEPARAGGVSVQFGPTKSAPGSRLKGGK